MSETGKYKVPKNVVKIPDGDTGYNLVKSKYNRFIWTWNNAPKNEDDDYSPKHIKHLDESEELDDEALELEYDENDAKNKEEEEDREDTDEASGWDVDMGANSGMGQAAGASKGSVGYRSGPLSNGKMMPTDAYEDPDEREQRKKGNVQRFKDFNPKKKKK